jgi:hypothetical protein
VQSDAKIDSSWVVSLCLTSAIVDCTTTFTEPFMDASWEAIVAMSCCTYCWVSSKLDCKVLKQDSSSWLRVWAMRMGELKREWAGSEIFAEK